MNIFPTKPVLKKCDNVLVGFGMLARSLEVTYCRLGLVTQAYESDTGLGRTAEYVNNINIDR